MMIAFGVTKSNGPKPRLGSLNGSIILATHHDSATLKGGWAFQAGAFPYSRRVLPSFTAPNLRSVRTSMR
jgi:hypothetical protein